MQVTCEKCDKSYLVPDIHGGLVARCSSCDHRMVLPIRDEEKLLEWAWSSEWNRLFSFQTGGGAGGHRPEVIDELIRIFEKRRAIEAEKCRLDREIKVAADIKPSQCSPTQSESSNETRKTPRTFTKIEDLLTLTPIEFELLIAGLFSCQGFEAFAVGGAHDGGIDVRMLTPNGKTLWGVAQCKRYSPNRPLGPGTIRAFHGAFTQTVAKLGYVITTSQFTPSARAAAESLSWLSLLDGSELLKLIRHVEITRGISINRDTYSPTKAELELPESLSDSSEV